MISFAQNFEDVLLWRCFKDRSNGFYIDVGASHPIFDNTTYWFYLSGWTGINVEPVPERHAELSAIRPKDINVRAVASSSSDNVLTLNRTRGVGGLSHVAPKAESRSPTEFEKSDLSHWEIPCNSVTLDSLILQYKPKSLDFIKIDAEGWEREVLSGLDLTRHRPQVFCIEATYPNSKIRSSDEWSHLLFKSGYILALFDGLNEYYIPSERRDLAELLSTPANSLDVFSKSTFEGSLLTRSDHPYRQIGVGVCRMLLLNSYMIDPKFLFCILTRDENLAYLEIETDEKQAKSLAADILKTLSKYIDPVERGAKVSAADIIRDVCSSPVLRADLIEACGTM